MKIASSLKLFIIQFLYPLLAPKWSKNSSRRPQGGLKPQVASEDLFCAFFALAIGPPHSPQSEDGLFPHLPYDYQAQSVNTARENYSRGQKPSIHHTGALSYQYWIKIIYESRTLSPGRQGFHGYRAQGAALPRVSAAHPGLRQKPSGQPVPGQISSEAGGHTKASLPLGTDEWHNHGRQIDMRLKEGLSF